MARKAISGLLEKTFPDIKFDEPVRLDGDASTREYFRVKGNNQVSVIIMLAPDKAGIEAFCEITVLIKEMGVDAPAIYGADGRGAAIEDLSDTLLQDHVKTLSGQARVSEYQRLIDDLLDFQSAAMCYKDRSLPCFNLAFDNEKLAQEVEFANDHFLDKYLGARPTPSDLAVMREEWSRITVRLAEETPVLAHRDFHSRNIMVKNKRRVWIDYQDARMGRFQYDLASLLLDPYAGLPEKIADDLANYYYEKLSKITDNQSDYGQFMEIYVLSGVQRLYKALGTFGYQTTTRGVDTYVEYIPTAVSSLIRLLYSRSDLKALADTFNKYFPA